jgi:lysophospholipase L1-like esterase
LRQGRSWLRAAILFAAIVVCAAPAGLPAARAASPECHAPLDVVRLANPLPRVAHKLRAREPLLIVAIGSSSTAGAGASSRAATYPSRLQDELSTHFPKSRITVINRGIGGEVITDMLRRFDKVVIQAKPDLVLWQLGTNSVLRHKSTNDRGALIRSGIARVRATGADLVLIDPQFAPKVISKPEALPMVALIALTAKQQNVDLFPRFDLMKRWHDVDHLDFKSFVSADGLHMNDWSYACLARGLSTAIVDAATRPFVSAKAAPTHVP